MAQAFAVLVGCGGAEDVGVMLVAGEAGPGDVALTGVTGGILAFKKGGGAL